MIITIDQQIDVVGRAIAAKREKIAGYVRRGQIPPGAAEETVAALTAVLATLRAVQALTKHLAPAESFPQGGITSDGPARATETLRDGKISAPAAAEVAANVAAFAAAIRRHNDPANLCEMCDGFGVVETSPEFDPRKTYAKCWNCNGSGRKAAQ